MLAAPYAPKESPLPSISACLVALLQSLAVLYEMTHKTLQLRVVCYLAFALIIQTTILNPTSAVGLAVFKACFQLLIWGGLFDENLCRDSYTV